MLIYLLAVVLILVSFHVSTRYSQFGRAINKIPGLRPLPFVGNLLTLNCSSEEVWSKLRHLADEFYPIFKVWKMTGAVVLIRHPDDIKAILSCKKNINKSSLAYGHIKHVGYNGLIASDASVWHHRRKILNQAFNVNLVEAYSETIRKRAESFVKNFRSEGESIVKDITQEFLKFSLAAVCDATMGFDLNSIPDMEQKYRNGFTEFSETVSYRVVRPYIRDWMMKFLPIGRRQSYLWKLNEYFVSQIINERRNYLESLIEKNPVNNYADLKDGTVEDHVEGKKRMLSVLDLLLLTEKEGSIDSRGILDEVTTIVLAGFETTGMSIAYLLVLLAENKEAQDSARAELRDVMGDDDTITLEHVKQLDYLDRCLKESLRILPVAPYIGRTITEEIVMSNYKLPVGTELFVSIYDLHRDPNFWPNPEKFDPDRFLPDNVQDRHPFAYVPFSGGLRNCIGQKLAATEMKTIVAYIINDYYLEPIDFVADFKFDLKVTLLVDNVHLKFVRIRDGQ